MKKFYQDFKVLILIFCVFFGVVYSAIRIDQALGWEKARNERNCRRIELENEQFFDDLVNYWNSKK
jgi:hypothetical protein